MDTQNVTLALPKELVREAKHLAIEKETSLSGLLADYLRQMLREDASYRAAMERAADRMRKGYDLGTDGQIRCKREELHER